MKTFAAVVVCGFVFALAGCREAPAQRPKGTIAPLDVEAPPADALRTGTGLAYRKLVSGKGGSHPKATSVVVVHYTGWMPDGTIVEGAPVGGPTVSFHVADTMPGWREGLSMMSEGDKWRFWIPARMAYGDLPNKPHGDLVYDIELVRFVE